MSVFSKTVAAALVATLAAMTASSADARHASREFQAMQVDGSVPTHKEGASPGKSFDLCFAFLGDSNRRVTVHDRNQDETVRSGDEYFGWSKDLGSLVWYNPDHPNRPWMFGEPRCK